MMVVILILINLSNFCLKDLLISLLIFKENWKGRCSVFDLECHISFFRMLQLIDNGDLCVVLANSDQKQRKKRINESFFSILWYRK